MNEPAIFIESKPVDFGNISTGKDHLYLVFQDSDGSETVIRGDPDSNNPLAFGNIVVEVDVPISQSEDKREIDEDGERILLTPADRNSRQIDLGDRDASAVWEVMKQQATNIHNANIDYNAGILAQNSNSTIVSVLNSVGLSFDNNLPLNKSINNFLGANNLLDLATELEGTENKDIIQGYKKNDTLNGAEGDDLLKGERGNDILDGGAGNDNLDGGEGDRDIAVFTQEYTVENYPYLEGADGTITLANNVDGIDTLRNIEWGFFKKTTEDLENQAFIPSSEDGEMQAMVASATARGPRVIPLPLTDGVETTEYVEVQDTTTNPNPNDPPTPPNVSLTAPVAMLDGDVDYTLNISPYESDTEYNVVYVIDTSISIDPVELQTIQDAYTDLTNFYINQGIAENINFGVVSYDSSGRFHANPSGGRNLTAEEAIAALQDLTIDTRIGTRYYDGLNQADRFLLNSRYNPFETTGIGYFITDGQNSGDRFDMLLKARDVRELANF